MSDALIARLEAVNRQLRERVDELELALGMRISVPVALGLTGAETRLLAALMSRELCSKEFLMSSLYGHRPSQDEPEIKIVDVFMCKLRKKLRPFEIEISTLWGQGYSLPPASRLRLKELLPA